MAKYPIVDLSVIIGEPILTTDSKAQVDHAIQQVSKAFSTCGFAYLIGHGISSELVCTFKC